MSIIISFNVDCIRWDINDRVGIINITVSTVVSVSLSIVFSPSLPPPTVTQDSKYVSFVYHLPYFILIFMIYDLWFNPIKPINYIYDLWFNPINKKEFQIPNVTFPFQFSVCIITDFNWTFTTTVIEREHMNLFLNTLHQ